MAPLKITGGDLTLQQVFTRNGLGASEHCASQRIA